MTTVLTLRLAADGQRTHDDQQWWRHWWRHAHWLQLCVMEMRRWCSGHCTVLHASALHSHHAQYSHRY